jgi:hypothetical protein
MNKKVLIGLTLGLGILYKILTFKIGPCSPELEDTINRKENRDQNIS